MPCDNQNEFPHKIICRYIGQLDIFFAINTMIVPKWLWNYAKDVSRKCGFDDSHSLRHFVNTVVYTKMIINHMRAELDVMPLLVPGVSQDLAEEILSVAAFSHDLIDKKYMLEEEGIFNLRKLFMENNYHHVNTVMEIITAISFSVRFRRLEEGMTAIAPGPLNLATAIIADADQLDSYDIARCIIYQQTRFSGPNFCSLTAEKREELCLMWTKTILVKRVLQYIPQYMNTEIAKKIAAPLHKLVEFYVQTELDNIEMVDYPN